MTDLERIKNIKHKYDDMLKGSGSSFLAANSLIHEKIDGYQYNSDEMLVYVEIGDYLFSVDHNAIYKRIIK